MQSPNRRRIFLALGLLIILIIIGLILVLPSKKRGAKSPGDAGQYVDPLSHQIVSNPPGKAPDVYGQPKNLPLYLGFDSLLDYGLTVGQLDNLKVAFYRYSQTLPRPLSQISVDVNHITTQHDPTDPNSLFTILFKVQFDQRSNYQAKAEYSGLDDIRLHLIDPMNSKTLYDSQVLYSSGQSD